MLCFSEPKLFEINKGVEEYSDQILRFDESIQDKLNIENTLREVISIFDINVEDISDDISIETVQLQLLSRYNIFWVPVLQNLNKRRLRRINSISSDQ